MERSNIKPRIITRKIRYIGFSRNCKCIIDNAMIVEGNKVILFLQYWNLHNSGMRQWFLFTIFEWDKKLGQKKRVSANIFKRNTDGFFKRRFIGTPCFFFVVKLKIPDFREYTTNYLYLHFKNDRSKMKKKEKKLTHHWNAF